jgi:hypothetical protein
MMVKRGLEIFFFEIPRAPSEIPANHPGQFSLSEQIFLHWAAATLKARGISKYFFLDHFSPSFLRQKWSIQDLRF